MVFRVEKEIGGRTLLLESGKLAKQANGAVMVSYGGSVVLVAAAASPSSRQEDFFPLTVDYREKLFAAGKIPGGRYLKRETRPGTKEILTSRCMDRPLRPLFPEGYTNEVQVTASVLSADSENDPDILGMIGGSAALAVSDIPFPFPIGSVRIGRVDGQFVVNPTHDQIDHSQLNLIVSASKDAVLMVEAGASEVDEDVMIDAIELGHQVCRDVIALQEELVAQCGKPKMQVEPPQIEPELQKEIRDRAYEPMLNALQVRTKKERYAAVDAVRTAVLDAYAEKEIEPAKIRKCIDKVQKEAMRSLIKTGTRCDGRKWEDIRPITCEVGLLPRTHGSSVFTRGETQALVVATLGTATDEEHVSSLKEEYTRKFMLQYFFPAFSVGEVRPDRGPGRREIGHGALAERSFAPVLPDYAEFPYTVRVVSEIMESNGSSSMATICGATLSLMDAGIPIRDPVAGIAMGLVKEGDEHFILSDILGDEDHYGDMDFKVAGTQHGITALQMDVKVAGLPKEVLRRALHQAREGRMFILKEMLKTIAKPREAISDYAPRLLLIKINPSKIGTVIGPGGKMIRKLEEESGAKIEIEDDGTITISSVDMRAAEKAKHDIELLTSEPELGKVYTGKVTGVREFGAFVEIIPGCEGLVHVSELDDKYVEKVEDVVKIGDELTVKIINIDEQGRVKLSRKVLLREARKGQEGGGAGGEGEGEGEGGGGGRRPSGGRHPHRPRDGRGGRPHGNDQNG